MVAGPYRLYLAVLIFLGTLGLLVLLQYPYTDTSVRMVTDLKGGTTRPADPKAVGTRPAVPVTTTSNIGAIRLCTAEERISHTRSVCDKLPSREAHPPISWVNTYVDNNHRLNFCWMSKAGCTAIKAVIFEANGLKFTVADPSEGLENVHIHQVVNKRKYLNVSKLSDLTPSRKKTVLTDYTNMLAVRHPLARLYSYYKDKLVDTKDVLSAHIDRRKTIKNFVSPRGKRLPSGPPSFHDFLYWAYKTRLQDDHWARIVPTCDACGRHWNAVLRVETMDTDAKVLMRQLNMTAERMPLVHTHNRQQSHSEYSHVLKPYSGVAREVMAYWLEYFRTDMDMFGYGWDTDSLTATCAIPVEGGYCC